MLDLYLNVGIKFGVVRDNRVNRNTDREVKPASPQCTTSTNEQVISNLSEKGYDSLFQCYFVLLIILMLPNI
jgi:hypothetical protein